jgi:uncharacterized membrane protein
MLSAIILPAVIGCASLLPASAVPQDPGAARAVAALLTERCAPCHAPDSGKRKAIRSWADAGDLAATVSDPELIVAGDALASTLYQVVVDAEMPPSDADVDPLGPAELALLRTWIADGAVLPALDPTAGTAESGAEPAPEQSALLRFAGRFHPLLVHFPIALWSVAPLAELLARWLRRDGLRTAADFCLTVGTLAALPAAVFGWLLAESSRDSETLNLHRGLGIATVAVAGVAALAVVRWPRLRLPLMLLVAGLAGLTGHLGALMSWGENWLSFPAA